MSYCEEFAAKRFRQYKWEMRKAALGSVTVSLVASTLMQAAAFLEQTGLVQRRPVEKITVE